MKIFITGATGFLGVHIAIACIAKGHEVLCLKRNISRNLFSPDIEKYVKWVNLELVGWQHEIQSFEADILIHAAWEGVSSLNRNDEAIQRRNIELTATIMTLCPYKQIIMLGSQDEYGKINTLVDEIHPLHPITEYAKVKIECCNLLIDYCETKCIEWHWIRVFSVFGEFQSVDWLIPSVIKRCLSGDRDMDVTLGEQVYSYLYSSDFASAIKLLLGVKGKSGIYNLSSHVPVTLKDLFLEIKKHTSSSIHFNFGALPYRKDQSMLIMGDSRKFIDAFGTFQNTNLETGLLRTIEYYQKKW